MGKVSKLFDEWWSGLIAEKETGLGKVFRSADYNAHTPAAFNLLNGTTTDDPHEGRNVAIRELRFALKEFVKEAGSLDGDEFDVDPDDWGSSTMEAFETYGRDVVNLIELYKQAQEAIAAKAKEEAACASLRTS
jgi:hypothetical protein